MKKKILALALMLIAVAMLAGGTVAYFTSEEIAHNVITTGGIGITLDEKALKDGELTDFIDVEGVMPGESVSKIVSVTNTGANAAWVRVSVEKAIELAEGAEGEPDAGLVSIEYDAEHWTDGGDGWWYYNVALEPGASTEPLFEEVVFAASMSNMYQGCTAHVDVTAQAAQVANNGDSVLEAQGWPE